MTARDRTWRQTAIELLRPTYDQWFPCLCNTAGAPHCENHHGDDVINDLLAALPADVLAHLAIEGDGLKEAEGHHAYQCDWRLWCEQEDLFDSEPACTCQPVYRLSEAP